MANYPQEFAQDAVCQSHTGHMTGLWFLPARPLRLNTNEWMNEWILQAAYLTTIYKKYLDLQVYECKYTVLATEFSSNETCP